MTSSFVRFFVAGVAVGASVATAATAPSIAFPNGATISGTTETNILGGTVNVFRGIPFAEAPVGERRWKPSILQAVAGNINATAYGSVCVSDQSPGSEDCLFLNVFAPPGANRDSKFPVMVLIHSGGFMHGASNEFDGANLVGASNNKIVYVSFNYRVGVFDFFSNKALLSEGRGANFGLQDQEVAFTWVKKYIEHFGGDPDDITAVGVSAGSMSIALHLLSRDGDQKLFNRAIMQSGAYPATHDTSTASDQESQVLTIAKGVGCESEKDVLACLRQADTSTVFKVGGPLHWFPTVDGVYMKEMPIQRLLAGKVSHIPTIIGTNRDEGWNFTSDAADPSLYDSFVRSRFPMLTEAEYERVNDLYPTSGYLTAHHRAAEIFADSVFVCPSEQFSRALATDTVTHRYYFNFTTNELGYPLVFRGKEVAFVFNQELLLPKVEGTQQVVDYFQTYWINFATTGSPNGNNPLQSSLLVWPPFNSAEKQLVIQPRLDVETNGVAIPRHSERCAFWLNVEKRIISEVAFI